MMAPPYYMKPHYALILVPVNRNCNATDLELIRHKTISGDATTRTAMQFSLDAMVENTSIAYYNANARTSILDLATWVAGATRIAVMLLYGSRGREGDAVEVAQCPYPARLTLLRSSTQSYVPPVSTIHRYRSHLHHEHCWCFRCWTSIRSRPFQRPALQSFHFNIL